LRVSVRSVALGAIVVLNVGAVLAVGLLPGTLADAPGSSPSQDTPIAMARSLMLDEMGAATPTATPSPSPTASPSPTPSPSPTRKPTPRPTRKPTPLPDTVAGARQYVKNAVGIKQYNCIDYVWTRESKWNPLAGAPTRAYGIPQAFPGSKMASFGSNWLTSPLTQVKWGLSYVKSRYGSACGAYTFWKAHGWY
jgi:peptidoglycan DL-endopeptidase CwlO